MDGDEGRRKKVGKKKPVYKSEPIKTVCCHFSSLPIYPPNNSPTRAQAVRTRSLFPKRHTVSHFHMADFIERDTNLLEGLGSVFSYIHRARHQRCCIAFLGHSAPFSATHASYTWPHHSNSKVERKICSPAGNLTALPAFQITQRWK